ncbi:MAG TPA: WYL domain-containing protein, partial [Nitrospiraceae bacterium]|nr:WYL domain-containing protein [Nitrospiraceae bacterium]
MYQLPLGYKCLPPITLSPYELMSLYLAKSHLTYLAGTPFWDDLEGVIKKIESSLTRKTVNHLDRIVQAFVASFRNTRAYESQKDVLLALRKSLLLQETIVLNYRKPSLDDPASYHIDPYALYLYQGGLYLWAYTHASKAMRMFAVERITSVELTQKRFEIRHFSSEGMVEKRFGVVEDG